MSALVYSASTTISRDTRLLQAQHERVRRDLPAGTVTFLFTDVEGSTKLLHAVGAADYAQALAEHRRILRDAFTAHGGVEVDTQGDAFFIAFPTAPGALAAAALAQEWLASGPIRVRMGIHTGTPHLGDEGYVGVDVHRAARIAAVGHGGQVLVSAATAALVGTDGLRDLGLNRLKDLSAPERISQLGEGEFPPLRTLHQTNLPVMLTPFIGRDRELAELSALLGREEVRVLTLTGPGGTGKTRLALQAAAAAADPFAGGVWWVPLAALRDPALVVPTAAQTLGVEGDLAARIGDQRLLLLFDNFEQVVAAAPEVGRLLERCPRLAVLSTSREPLRLDGEWEYALDPLREAEAVALFELRARATRYDFSANGEVREICARLDNLPLAIELAAARVKVLSPRAMLERLERHLPVLGEGRRDAPERQRTLRGAIAWSYDLLDPEEKQAFARLAVFRGGWTLEAAEAAADADLDTLQSLVDKSLLRHRDDRFSMLETIREYAAERLEASGEAEALRRRHAEHFLALAEETVPNIRGMPKESLDRLEREHDNLRAALDQLEASGETQLALRLGGALWRFWYQRGYMAEGGRRLETALAADGRPTAARATALTGATSMANEGRGDFAAARRHAEEALAINQALGNPWAIAHAQFHMGNVLIVERDFAAARRLFEESARIFDELADEHYAMLATFHIAWMCGELGERERSRALSEENLRRARAAGNTRIEGLTLDSLANFARDEGRIEDALSLLRDALHIHLEAGNRSKVADSLSRIAHTLAVAGRAATAVRLLSRSVALYGELAMSGPPYVAERKEQTLGIVRGQLDEAVFAEAWERGRALSLGDAVALALDSGE